MILHGKFGRTKTLMSKLQVNDLSPVIDSFALTEDQAKNIVGGGEIKIEFEVWGVKVTITIDI